MKDRLLRWFWRDPDVIWAWASGQMTRRWWLHPTALTAIALFMTGSILAFFFVPRILIAEPWLVLRQTKQLCIATAYVLGIVFFCIVAIRPFQIFQRMGGKPMLRELSLTRLSIEETGRAMFWGSYRRSALPCLILFYAFGIFLVVSIFDLWKAIEVFLTVLDAKTPPAILWKETEVFLTVLDAKAPHVIFGYWMAIAPIVWFLFKAPFDHMMNLAIAWRMVSTFGPGPSCRFWTAALIFFGFPGLTVLVQYGFLHFWMALEGHQGMLFPLWVDCLIFTGGSLCLIWKLWRRPGGRLAAISVILCGGVIFGGPWSNLPRMMTWAPQYLPGSTQFWHFAIRALMGLTFGSMSLYAIKALYARHCYEKFITEWDRGLENDSDPNRKKS